ncbi:hypothetical protein CPB84DRAFT_1852972 [Gymnopilus junonius]|uniref:Uncharacterized protein n=1 Tax=Gymnopilus junonius TaxID=109634 RepID=A0A9P5TFY9_GYMJU|nr:hypothetical protein CPB84DRAFT_1852972 [Gymnopilus junonius]
MGPSTRGYIDRDFPMVFELDNRQDEVEIRDDFTSHIRPVQNGNEVHVEHVPKEVSSVPLPLSFKRVRGQRRQIRDTPPPVVPTIPPVWTNSTSSISSNLPENVKQYSYLSCPLLTLNVMSKLASGNFRRHAIASIHSPVYVPLMIPKILDTPNQSNNIDCFSHYPPQFLSTHLLYLTMAQIPDQKFLMEPFSGIELRDGNDSKGKRRAAEHPITPDNTALSFFIFPSDFMKSRDLEEFLCNNGPSRLSSSAGHWRHTLNLQELQLRKHVDDLRSKRMKAAFEEFYTMKALDEVGVLLAAEKQGHSIDHLDPTSAFSLARAAKTKLLAEEQYIHHIIEEYSRRLRKLQVEAEKLRQQVNTASTQLGNLEHILSSHGVTITSDTSASSGIPPTPDDDFFAFYSPRRLFQPLPMDFSDNDADLELDFVEEEQVKNELQT